MNNFIGEESVIRKSIQRISPKFVDWSRENKYLKNIVFSARNKNLVRSKLENEIKNRLTNEIYKEDIIRFAKLTNKNLDHWLVNN